MCKSILFISPDYHCSFFYRDELRKLGWKADIFVPPNYPEVLLFAQPDFIFRPISGPSLLRKIHRVVWVPLFFLLIALRYKYHFYYCGLDHLSFGEDKVPIFKKHAPSFRIHLLLSKLFGRKVIHLPSGVPDEEMPEIVETLGNLEEGVRTEDPARMKIWFDVLRRYAHVNLGYGLLDSTQYRATHIKYKAIDLDVFNPNIQVPERFKLPATTKLRVLHSFMLGEKRLDKYKGNIKGTKYIQDAMDRLIAEGYPVEYMYFDSVPSNQYRYYQVQADIVVEEIIRGGWGSTAVECLALGKPVITYVRPEWEEFYYRCFPEAKPIPIINANKHNIYEVLKQVVTDSELRKRRAAESRRWAELHLNPVANVKAFTKILEPL